MRKRIRFALLIGIGVTLIAIAATAAVSHRDIAYRTGEYRGAETGEVLVSGEVVFSIRTAAGGLSPVDRSRIATERLQGLPENAYTANNVAVKRVGEGSGIYVGNTFIVSVSPAEAKAHNTTHASLAVVWRDNLSRAFTGEVIGSDPGKPEESTDWVSTSQKWVPIFSLEQEGVRVGAAQVAGPSVQVEKVKGVAQLRLDFRNVARIYAYIPVSSISTKLDRVQGVSVWAIGDIKILGF